MSGRRLGGAVAAFAMAALSLTLTGCDLAGRIDVRSEQEIVVDLYVSDAAQACVTLSEQSLASLSVVVDRGGCRVTGTLGRQNPAPELVALLVVGEHYVLDLSFPEGAGEVPMDVIVTFPGMVLDGGGGRTDSHRVHFERGFGLGGVGKVRIVALNHPGPLWWELAAGGGVLLGALSTVTVLLLLRRRRQSQTQGTGEVTELASIGDGLARAEEGDHPSPPVAVPITHPPGPLAGPVDHSIWAPPEGD